MSQDNTIFELQKSRQDREFIAKNAEIELDVALDIAETLTDIPYLGSLIKLGKVYSNIKDYHFIRKLGKFLEKANELEDDQINEFVSNLKTEEKKHISNYMTQLLYNAEEEAKAELMGKVYKRRVMGELDNSMMLRLCSIINRCYLEDLYSLEEFLTVSDNQNFVTDNLLALGVLADAGNVYNEEKDGYESMGWGPTKHSLNEVGLILYQILTDKPIDISTIERNSKQKNSIKPIAENEIDEIVKSKI